MEATMFGRQNIVRWLLHELKVDITEQNRYGVTALHIAANRNQMGCARLLLDVRTQHLKNRNGSTPLHYAKGNGHKEMQELLESHFHLS